MITNTMALIKTNATDKTPGILLDGDKHVFEIEGNSRPENVRDFYVPVVQSLNDFFEQRISENKIDEFKDYPFRLNFKLGYFNSSSAKFLADILIDVVAYMQKGVMAKVYWYYDEGDEDMREAGEDFSEMIDLPFNYVMISKR